MEKIASFFRVLIPLVLCIMPGWGHIWVHRYNRGLSIFILFFTIGNGLILLILNAATQNYSTLMTVGQAALVGLFVFAIVDIIRITVWLKSKTVANRRRGQYRRSLVHFLRGEYEMAENQANRMIRTDPLDSGALMVLGMIQREAGEPKKALRTFRRGLRAVTSDYWHEDLRREIEVTRNNY
ncbi:MAG: tetratricopeptide (TPR) repeat protein [Planctomycetota bacterium]|jgi:tetratricopeptide (TPR) repeat protein